MKRATMLNVAFAAAAVAGIGLVGSVFVISGKKARPSAEYYAYNSSAGEDGGLPVLWSVPEFSFPDQSGRTTTAGQLKGRPFIADFIFTTCTTVCPLITAKMVLLQRRLPSPELRFVSFSVDPANDTPAVLGEYARQWRPEGEPRWTLLATTPKGLEDVAEGMRVAVEPSEDEKNAIMHSSTFFLVDAKGDVRGVYDSNDDVAVERLVRDAQSLFGKAGSLSAKADGETLYRTLGCPACHTRPDLAPELRGTWGKQVALEGGARVTVDRAYLRESITAPGAKVVDGYLRLMPSYDGQISNQELDVLLKYVEGLTASAPDPAAPVGTGGAAAEAVAAALADPASAPAGTTSVAALAKGAPVSDTPGAKGVAVAPSAPAATNTTVSATTAAPTSSAAPSATIAVAPTAASKTASSQAASSNSSTSKSAKAPSSTAKTPAVVIDPVCSMKVRVTSSTPRTSHAGHTHYFCSPMCRDRFVAQPSRYEKTKR
ncbi:MAG: SCO family protein [Polyangiaceae bacterium]